jgi:hypothetical protein
MVWGRPIRLGRDAPKTKAELRPRPSSSLRDVLRPPPLGPRELGRREG